MLKSEVVSSFNYTLKIRPDIFGEYQIDVFKQGIYQGCLMKSQGVPYGYNSRAGARKMIHRVFMEQCALKHS